MKFLKHKTIFTCLLFYLSLTTQAAAQLNGYPKVSIIIDDLGYDAKTGLQTAQLPGPITCAVLPNVRFSVVLANQCHQQNKEVILHTPMEALIENELDPGGLYDDMSKTEFLNTLYHDLKAVPFIIGINNHEGSLLTAEKQQMEWVMQTLKEQHLFFVDSVTSHHSVAGEIAKQTEVPTLSRDIFLDDNQSPEAIRAQFQKLLMTAKRNGYAIAIGHPYPATLQVLSQELLRLPAEGYALVPLSELMSSSLQLSLGCHCERSEAIQVLQSS